MITIAYWNDSKVMWISDGPINTQDVQTSTTWFDYYPGNVATTATRAAHGALPAGTARTAAGYATVKPPRQHGAQNPKVMKSYYDAAGREIETADILGNVTMAGYDDRDHLLWTEDEEGNPTDHSWDTINDVLLSTTGPDPDGAGPLGRPITTNRYDEQQIGTASTAGAALPGLQASYYANLNLAGRPDVRRNDAAVDLNWGMGGPSGITATDNFSVRWTGNLLVPSTGSYTFSTYADDGTRLTIDEVQLLDNWVEQSAASVSSRPITLTAGTHKLQLEYFDATGPAQVQLRWSCAACSPATPLQTIPSWALRPAWFNLTSTVSPLGRVTFSHFADPASMHPDYTLVRPESGTDVVTSYSYDPYGRITQKVMPNGNAGRTIDAQGNLQGVPDATYATDRTYYAPDATAAPPGACGGGQSVSQAELLKEVRPRGVATTTYVYDTAGRPIATTKGVGTTCRAYSSEGRLTSVNAPGDPQPVIHTYDPSGAVRTVQDATGTVATEYDEAGRIKRTVDSFGAEATYLYDREGNITRRTAAIGPLATNIGYVTSYTYDDGNRLRTATDPAGRISASTYDIRGNLRTLQLPNSTFVWYEYNRAGWLTSIYNRHGILPDPLPTDVPADDENSSIVDFSYAYDLEGNRSQEVRSGGALPTTTNGYAYDDLGRLSEINLPNGSMRRYFFDRDSNRTRVTENGQTTATYTYDPSNPATQGVDQLTTAVEGGQTRNFGYRPDGEMTIRGADTLTWDGRGRLVGGTFGGTTLTYSFDAGGFRRSRTASGSTTRFIHSGLFEDDGAGTITLTAVDGPRGDIAHYAGPPTTGTSVKYRYFNAHGDLVALADANGVRTDTFTYDVFGTPGEAQPVNTALEGWTGRWGKKLDTTGSLIEMGVRPYDPALGRFLAVDPVEGGSLNAYDYALQNPITQYDLDGRCAHSELAASPGGCRTTVVCLPLIGCRVELDCTTSPPRQLPPRQKIGGSKRKVHCTVRCNVAGPSPCGDRPPHYVTGSATGTNRKEACKRAQRVALSRVPRGCTGRHCHPVNLGPPG